MTAKNVTSLQKKTVIVNGYATADLTKETLAQWADSLTYVSYYSYGFTMEGDLIPLNDEKLIQDAKANGLAPMMVLTPVNASGEYSYDLVKIVFENPVVRDRLINNIVLTVLERDYYGVVFNFGYIATEDKEEFVMTVSKSAARLNRLAALTIVSLMPGINDKGIDYRALSNAANFLEFRSFRWEQVYEPPMPIAPINVLRGMLQFYLPLVDPSKVLLAIPNYAFDWALPFVPWQTTAEILSNKEAVERANQMNATIHYDDALQTPYYNYFNESGTEHIVWFDDQRSITAKIQLVNEFNIAGISIWTVMFPFPAGTKAINESFIVFKV